MVLPLSDSAPTRIVPIGTYGLIALNVILYLVQLDRGRQFTTAFAATPYEITHGEDIQQPFELVLQDRDRPIRQAVIIPQGPVPFPVWLTLFTAMFLHGNLLHLTGNMLYLWIFGDNVEEVLGTARFLVVYLCCGLMGSLAQIAAAPDSYLPTLGASGAIAGVMGAYLIWFPYNLVRVLFFRYILEVPALIVIGLWILIQLWQGFGSLGRLGLSGGVAYLAHVGGAATGIFAALLFRDRARPFQQSSWFS
ncbi:MAG: rhomboid family intramembrane serine protease [Isosphaeraceae bacterium]|nr:rhomboid family intramembrane serine protease [Isosphaeraceae bacterium]